MPHTQWMGSFIGLNLWRSCKFYVPVISQIHRFLVVVESGASSHIFNSMPRETAVVWILQITVILHLNEWQLWSMHKGYKKCSSICLKFIFHDDDVYLCEIFFCWHQSTVGFFFKSTTKHKIKRKKIKVPQNHWL